MPQIDFYITKETSPQSALRTACRITEKAFHAGMKVHLQTIDGSNAEKLDSLLWTFRDRSFIPHQIFENSQAECPVTISTDSGPQDAEILVNMSDQLPENIERFQRIAEIIDNKAESIHAGRERYRFYREHGYNPTHHEVSSS